MTEPTIHEWEKDLAELKKQHTVLEKKMNMKQAETETALERMNATFERLRTDMANRKTDRLDREKRINNATMIMVGGATAFPSALIGCAAYFISVD